MGFHPVIKKFKDAQDNGRLNEVDNWFPRYGLDVSDERRQKLIDGGYIGDEYPAQEDVEEVEDKEEGKNVKGA